MEEAACLRWYKMGKKHQPMPWKVWGKDVQQFTCEKSLEGIPLGRVKLEFAAQKLRQQRVAKLCEDAGLVV